MAVTLQTDMGVMLDSCLGWHTKYYEIYVSCFYPSQSRKIAG